jgi:hypothetical protein
VRFGRDRGGTCEQGWAMTTVSREASQTFEQLMLELSPWSLFPQLNRALYRRCWTATERARRRAGTPDRGVLLWVDEILKQPSRDLHLVRRRSGSGLRVGDPQSSRRASGQVSSLFFVARPLDRVGVSPT